MQIHAYMYMQTESEGLYGIVFKGLLGFISGILAMARMRCDRLIQHAEFSIDICFPHSYHRKEQNFPQRTKLPSPRDIQSHTKLEVAQTSPEPEALAQCLKEEVLSPNRNKSSLSRTQNRQNEMQAHIISKIILTSALSVLYHGFARNMGSECW